MSTKFRFYSMAVVAADLLNNTPEGEFWAYEVNTELDGELSTAHVTDTAKGVDASGNSYSLEISFSDTIKATWLHLGGTHRATPPNLRSGEIVMLMVGSDVDQYYWTTMGLHPERRTLEDVLWYFSNKTSRDDKTLNADNSYYVHFSTEKKILEIKTNKNNGEPYAYSIRVDTGNGNIYTEDDNGTRYFLDSEKQQVRSENSTGSYIELIGDTINLHATKVINISAPDMNVTIDNTITEKCTTLDMSNKTTKLDNTTTDVSSSNVSVSASSTSIQSNVSVQGDTTFTGSVSANGKKIDETHKHTSSSPGNPTSPVI